MDDLILNKAKAPNSLAKISVPKYLKGALVLNITFKKIYWDLTTDNIERHRDDETGGEYIDFYGVVVVRAIDDVGNFDTKVIADVEKRLEKRQANVDKPDKNKGDVGKEIQKSKSQKRREGMSL